jgi:hypothetical protein
MRYDALLQECNGGIHMWYKVWFGVIFTPTGFVLVHSTPGNKDLSSLVWAYAMLLIGAACLASAAQMAYDKNK